MSRFNTYNVDKGYMDMMYIIMEMEGEVTPEIEAKLVANEDDFAFKMEQAKKFKKYVKGEVSLIDAEIKRLREAKDRYKKQDELINSSIVKSFEIRGVDRFKNENVNIYPSISESVPDISFKDVPSRFHKDPEISKSDLKKAIKEGDEDVKHISLIKKTSLRIM